MRHRVSLKIQIIMKRVQTLCGQGMLAHNNVCGVGRVQDWASHHIEHELSALYDVTHGAGLAVIAPLWMRYVCKKNPGKLALFANRIFCGAVE